MLGCHEARSLCNQRQRLSLLFRLCLNDGHLRNHLIACLNVEHGVAPSSSSVLQRGGAKRFPALRCLGSNAHRSISPNTISSDPMMAETSASMWPRVRKSIAERCAKEGARILHL